MRRRSLVLAVTFIPFLWFGNSAPAQDDFPTAAELLQQGVQQLEAGDADAARETLGSVDRMQLSRDDRQLLDQALRDVETGQVTVSSTPTQEQTADEQPEPVEEAQPAPPTPEQLLAQADEDALASDEARQRQALDAYVELMNNEEASLDVRSLAAARHAQLRRKLNADLTAARRSLDMAAQDIREGRIADGQRKLDDLDASGVDLTWFDRHRMDALRAEIASVEVAAAEQPTPDMPAPIVDQPQTETPSNDLIQQARKILSQEKFAEGQQAQREGQLALAARLYEEAIVLDPSNVEAQQALPAVTAALASDQSQQQALSRDAEYRRLRVEQAIAGYDQNINEANSAAASLNYAAALDAVGRAQQELDRNRTWIPPSQLKDLRQEATDMQAALLAQRARHEAELIAQTEAKRQREQELDRLRELETLRKQVDELLIRAHELNASQNYDEALKVVDQAQFIQPNSIPAELLRSIIVNNRVLVKSRTYDRRRREAMLNLSLEARERMIPSSEPMVYPEDWPQITQRRLDNLPGGGDTEATRETLEQIRKQISVTFDQNTLESVIDALVLQTGANFFVNWPALEAIGIDRDSLVSLNLTNVSAERVLALVLQQLSTDFDPLTFSVIDGVVNISTELDLRSQSVIRVYDIRDLLVQIPNFTGAPDFDLAQALESADGGSSVFSEGDEENDDDEQLREEAIEDIITLVQESVGNADEWLNLESTVQELNGQLIIRTSYENHRQAAKLLDDIREARSSQITVEARLMLVNEDFLEDIGIDLDFRINNLGSNYTSLSVAQDSATVAQPVGSDITPSGFVPSRTLGDIFTPISGTNPAISPTGFASTSRALEMGVAYIDDLEVNLLVRATQSHRRSITLTAPHVTFANGQRAYIYVARQVSFISDLDVVSDAAALDPTVDVFSTGVILDVEGTISADRRYVTLTLRPSLSSLIDIRQIEFVGTAQPNTNNNDDNNNDILVSGTQELPELEVTQIRATVSIPDRGTLLVGGQRLIGETEIESGVPVLSKIPVIKRLFSNTSTVKDERTLLVLVKPTIIILNEEEELRFPGLLQDPDLFNEGRGQGF
ncbi:hypothetical protein [Mucisphaera calidilacus]|uniref:hypothetical protein n=1 Tax=Mucisphaera calidilacus TaxID=2527982 RepID=UPI00119F78E6|nr:hypothetical protein [Mucisphaera calidilacus]